MEFGLLNMRPYTLTLWLFLVIALLGELWQRSERVISVEDGNGETVSLHISRRDARRLELFFRKLIIKDPFAYTLAGSKPISDTSFRKPLAPFFMVQSPSMLQGWKIWEKYRIHFENPRFSFWIEENPWVKNQFLVVLADQYHCNQVVQQHRQDFEQVLNKSPVNFNDLLHTQPFFQNALLKHDALIGILFGFGRENSWDYCNPKKHKRLIWSMKKARRLIFRLKSRSRFFRTPQACDMLLPFFVGDPDSEESKDLKKTYLAIREKLIRYYEGKEFLEATLSLFMRGPSALE